ncbi:MAG: hypothetical protein HBSAPP02_28980 [Phycisphaerae bacterium]|nr:MAG: hypothetical protein HRU71_02115 [Planctomycetia bacterium]GJQ27866.1 MAG: hypothetical protein HBSAPP02_28980 [Phycisphaerae bacterium]
MAQSPASPQASPPNELSPEDRMLVRLRDQLYGGNWEEMILDLKCRLRGEPYIFKLASRIQDDLNRIERLRAMGSQRGDPPNEPPSSRNA